MLPSFLIYSIFNHLVWRGKKKNKTKQKTKEKRKGKSMKIKRVLTAISITQ